MFLQKTSSNLKPYSDRTGITRGLLGVMWWCSRANRLKLLFVVVRQLENHEIWAWLIICLTAADSCAVRSAVLMSKSDDRVGQEHPQHLFLDLNQLQMFIYSCNTCRKWADQLKTVSIMWLLKNRRSAYETMLHGGLSSYPGDNVCKHKWSTDCAYSCANVLHEAQTWGGNF